MNRIMVCHSHGFVEPFSTNVEEIAQICAERFPDSIYFIANLTYRVSEPVTRQKPVNPLDYIHKIFTPPNGDCTVVLFNNGVEICSHATVFANGEPASVHDVPALRPLEWEK